MECVSRYSVSDYQPVVNSNKVICIVQWGSYEYVLFFYVYARIFKAILLDCCSDWPSCPASAV